ncbi:MAG: hypothetical protein JWQ51_2915 [Tardiphaga sp.]|nr:hypothetical protein [Tardiphaga sp.]
MTHWPFIIAAYALTFGATGLLAWSSFAAMRRSEAEAEMLREGR